MTRAIVFYGMVGGLGFLSGAALMVMAVTGSSLGHLGLILAIAAPVWAFWRALKPRLAPYCPRKA